MLAHWAWFLPTVPDPAIGTDGHRTRQLPTSLPRRMFAASAVTFPAPLLLDERADIEILDARRRAQGRSLGDPSFVDVERTVMQRGTARVVERQTLVYRAATGGEGVSLPVPEGTRTCCRPGALVTPGRHISSQLLGRDLQQPPHPL
ncbi:hypothetical protein AB5I41_14645 [Sphingomonas sp. MMS24-JH45]